MTENCIACMRKKCTRMHYEGYFVLSSVIESVFVSGVLVLGVRAVRGVGVA